MNSDKHTTVRKITFRLLEIDSKEHNEYFVNHQIQTMLNRTVLGTVSTLLQYTQIVCSDSLHPFY